MRRFEVAVLVAWCVAIAASIGVGVDRLAEAGSHGALSAELRALGTVAGLAEPRDAKGSDPIIVRVETDGPTWVDAVAREVVAADPRFRVTDGPHRLTASVGVEPGAMVVRWSLERRGWAIHSPDATTRRLMPALAMLPLLLALGAWFRWRRPVLLAVGAAVAAQAAATWWPWPAAMPRAPTWSAESSLVSAIVGWARAMDDTAVAVAAGVVALAVVLAWFDHRRSRNSPSITAPLVGVVAGLAWIEAAVRVGCVPWATTWIGAMGVIATIGLVVAIVRRGREAT